MPSKALSLTHESQCCSPCQRTSATPQPGSTPPLTRAPPSPPTPSPANNWDFAWVLANLQAGLSAALLGPRTAHAHFCHCTEVLKGGCYVRFLSVISAPRYAPLGTCYSQKVLGNEATALELSDHLLMPSITYSGQSTYQWTLDAFWCYLFKVGRLLDTRDCAYGTHFVLQLTDLGVLNNVLELETMTLTMTSTMTGKWKWLHISLFSEAVELLKTVHDESQNDSSLILKP